MFVVASHQVFFEHFRVMLEVKFEMKSRTRGFMGVLEVITADRLEVLTNLQATPQLATTDPSAKRCHKTHSTPLKPLGYALGNHQCGAGNPVNQMFFRIPGS